METLRRRPRRLRTTESLRDLLAPQRLSASDFIAPLFVVAGHNIKDPIPAMPGQYRFSADLLIEEVRELEEDGVRAICLFPVVPESQKDRAASCSCDPQHFFQKAITAVKKTCPAVTVITDVAMDPYSSDGHDGLVDPQSGEILNDPSLEILTKMAVTQANSGADLVGPSDMMDGRVGAIRHALDKAGHQQVGILSYTAKYCSHFYGPFRQALDSAPKAGDKKSYQLDFRRRREALVEAQLDEQEGADILMVKPGLAYLDIVRDLAQACQLPIAAYQVSGEYAMIKAASEKGVLAEMPVVLETLTAFKRAGCDMILTYFAKQAARALKSDQRGPE